jgi:hypothetical protein
MHQIVSLVKNRRYTSAQQFVALRVRYPDSEGKLTHNGFVWTIDVTPTILSNTYRIKIVYQAGSLPQVYVVSPKPLKRPNIAKRLPHTYDTERQRICVCLPTDWNQSKLIADTVVHWSIQWLIYYEHWAYTGIWEGGGHGNWDVIPICDIYK